MASVDLVFGGEPLSQPANLVFGDDGSNPIKDALIGGTISITKPTLAARVATTIDFTGAFTIAKPTLTGQVAYYTDTRRPLVARVTARFQDADVRNEQTAQHWRDANATPVATKVRWQQADKLAAAMRAVFQDARRDARAPLYVRYQNGKREHRGVEGRFQEARKQPNVQHVRFQEGLGLPRSTQFRFQDGLRTPNTQHARYQDAIPYSDGWRAVAGSGRAINNGWKTRYQDANAPRPGRTDFTPPDNAEDPCYVPTGHLVFSTPWSGDTNLVFVCETHGTNPPEPGETIVVPVKKVYVVLNTATLHRVDGNVLLPTFSMSMSLDVDSWTWSFSASLPGRALPDLEPDGDGTPVLVEAVINAVPYRFLVEKIGRERAFASDGLRVTGRGLAAELDAPIAPVMNFGNDIDRTAQQLMGDVLSINGVPLPGWTVDWQIEDWLVKAGAWKKQGTYIDALNTIVQAAGGYLQPTPATKTVKALLRYPTLPWAWDEIEPDYELPAAAFTREMIDWVEKPRYDRAYVSGVGAGGRVANVRREGTAGENVAPMVTEALNTDAIAGRQRGAAILADTGRIANYSLRGAAGVRDVDNNPVGIIPPGKFVRYVDNGVEKLGITRSVSVEVQMPDIWQTISVETHENV